MVKQGVQSAVKTAFRCLTAALNTYAVAAPALFLQSVIHNGLAPWPVARYHVRYF